jgi:hypothetical protein
MPSPSAWEKVIEDVRRAHPVDALASVSAKAVLVVVGSHGRGAIGTVMLGSVTLGGAQLRRGGTAMRRPARPGRRCDTRAGGRRGESVGRITVEQRLGQHRRCVGPDRKAENELVGRWNRGCNCATSSAAEELHVGRAAAAGPDFRDSAMTGAILGLFTLVWFGWTQTVKRSPRPGDRRSRRTIRPGRDLRHHLSSPSSAASGCEKGFVPSASRLSSWARHARWS